MAKKLVLNLEILAGKANVKRVLIAKHWEEEIIDHILKVMVSSPIEKEECVERRAPTTHQVSKAFGVPKAFKIPRNCHRFQDPKMLQTTNELTVRKLLVYLTGPTSNLP